MIQRPADNRSPGPPRPPHIVLLGAAGTGKTRLTSDLRVALAGNAGACSLLQISDGPTLDSLLQTPGQRDGPVRMHLLLMGLDLPAPQGIRPSQAAADLDLRQMLSQAGLSYSVVYGRDAARLHSALDALHFSLSGRALAQTDAGDKQRPWVWACDNCSDPGCESRLLSALLVGRNR